MKRYCFDLLALLVCVGAAVSCTTPEAEGTYTPDPVGSYAYGADCSWITEEEQDGVVFYDASGEPAEGMRLLRDCGMNSMRLRVWVDHETGWCNKEDVLVKAKRAHDLQLRLMIDFHYSDNFADPSKQAIPAAWAGYDLEQLKAAVAEHTTDVLTALRDMGITPEWIQVGNETRNGMLWDTGRLWDAEWNELPDGWANYAALTTAGYDACKAVFPEAAVIVHIDNAYLDNRWFYRDLKQHGGRFDMIGLSHYPMVIEGVTWQKANEEAANYIRLLHSEFRCPIMVTEIGTVAAREAVGVQVVEDFRSRVDGLDYMAGIFYWEPQVYNNWRPNEYIALGWGAYNMGAFTPQGQPNAVLRALWKRP